MQAGGGLACTRAAPRGAEPAGRPDHCLQGVRGEPGAIPTGSLLLMGGQCINHLAPPAASACTVARRGRCVCIMVSLPPAACCARGQRRLPQPCVDQPPAAVATHCKLAVLREGAGPADTGRDAWRPAHTWRHQGGEHPCGGEAAASRHRCHSPGLWAVRPPPARWVTLQRQCHSLYCRTSSWGFALVAAHSPD